MTPGQRWKRQRNLVMATVSRAGFVQRDLADAFDLPPSRVCRILKSMTTESGIPVKDLSQDDFDAWLAAELKKTQLRPR